MNFARYLSRSSIKLDIDIPWEIKEDEEPVSISHMRKELMHEMAELLYASGHVQNQSKLYNTLLNIDKRNPSAIGCGIAIPHVRCMQAKTFIMGFARYRWGFEYGAPDNEEVQIFIPMISPPYNDRQYLRIYKTIAGIFLETDLRQELLEIEEPGEIIRILNTHYRH